MRNGQERRNKIIELLSKSDAPLSGSKLATTLGVSRQVIVQDIALLRSLKPDLISTNSGYILMRSSGRRRIFKLNHTDDQIEDELIGITDLGGTILDVFVEHKVYGTISAPLNISSKRDAQNYFSDMKSSVSTPLKNITNGYHYHTVQARSEAILDEIEQFLKDRGYLIETLSATTIYTPKSYNNV